MKAQTQALLAVCALAGAISAQDVTSMGNWRRQVIVQGKVVMEDGSVPPKQVPLWKQCSDFRDPYFAVTTDKNGKYTWSLVVDTVSSRTCSIHGVLDGYQSTSVDITDITAFSDPNLPVITLSPKGSGSEGDIFGDDLRLPSGTSAAWNQTMKAASAGNWAEAERQLRAVVKAAPKFARGWNALALACIRLHKSEDARDAYQRALELDPKLLAAYVPLARLNLTLKDWDAAAKTADRLIKEDTQQRYPEIYMERAIARYQLHDLDGAAASAEEAVRRDQKHQFPRAEYILGMILRTKRDYPAASAHLSKYLELEPKAADAEVIRRQIAELGKGEPEGTDETALDVERAVADVADAATAGGEAWVPGGMKALAAAAHMEGPLTYQNFFADYCRAIASEVSSTGTSRGFPAYIESLRAYMASVTELLPLGERRGNSSTITMSLATEAQRKQTERILTLLGWKLVPKKDSFTVEPGDQPADGLRQQIPSLFGFDEIDMQEALEAGRSFHFEIPSDNARLVGGGAWNPILKDLPLLPGGIAATFTTNFGVAKMYSGLGAMDPDTATAILKAVDLRTLAIRDGNVLARYSEAFSVVKNSVAVPGGAEAEDAWKKLTGASPSNPPAFFRALIEKDLGKLAAFYHALWRVDEAHRVFFTKTAARAARFYAWYRDSDEFHYGVARQIEGWRTDLLHDLPLDGSGNVRFPGGRMAWTNATAPDDEVLLSLKSLEALVPVSLLEQHRKSPLDQASAVLLAQYYAEWRPLFTYFEELPSLGRTEFEALATFAGSIGKSPPAAQNLVLGEWYSLVDLIARGVKAGSLDAAAGAQAFRRVCDGLAATDHSAQALATLREIAGGAPDVNEAVPARLLRLSGPQRSAYDRIMELQNVPRLDATASAADPAKTMTALSGFVYAASLDPDALLINEDPHVLSRHQFFAAENPAKRAVFSPAALMGRNQPPGTFIRGGFTNFDQIAHGLARAGGGVLRAVPPDASTPSQNNAAPIPSASGVAESAPLEEARFSADGRLVEVWATVTDSRGRYMDNLSADQFTILEKQQAQSVVAFESRVSPVSVALLLDTTGSMQAALPALKNAAMKLMSDLRAGDSVAVYSFNSSVTELQPFTTDMAAAKRAVLRTQALGETALYDALARVSRDLAGRPGKKVIVVFTDGNDNSSTLTTDTAILRAKATGVPIYTIAQGEALQFPAFVKQLADVSKATGGESFVIHDPNEIGAVFEKVSEELTHGYLLTFAPPAAQDHAFHAIDLTVQTKGLKPRFREGYYPQ